MSDSSSTHEYSQLFSLSILFTYYFLASIYKSHLHLHPTVPPELTFHSSPHHRTLSVLRDAADHFQNMFYSCVTDSSFLGFFMGSFLLLTLHTYHDLSDHLFTYDSQMKI